MAKRGEATRLPAIRKAKINMRRLNQILKETHHDVTAFTRSVTEGSTIALRTRRSPTPRNTKIAAPATMDRARLTRCRIPRLPWIGEPNVPSGRGAG